MEEKIFNGFPVFVLSKKKHIPIILEAVKEGKLQAQQEDFSPNNSHCLYSAPCAIGCVLPEAYAKELDNFGFTSMTGVTSLYALMKNRCIEADDPDFWIEVQKHHDCGEIDILVSRLEHEIKKENGDDKKA